MGKARIGLFYHYLQTIVGKGDSLGKPRIGLVVQSDTMRGVREISLAGTHPAGKVDSVVHQHVAVVRWLPSQGVDHQYLHALEVSHLFGLDGLHIGDVGQFAKTIGHDGKTAMHHRKRYDLYAAQRQWLVGRNGLQTEQRHTGIEMLGETIGHDTAQIAGRRTIGIDGDIAKDGEGAKIVYAPDMVVMGVGKEYGRKRTEGQRHELLTDVGAAVYEDAGVALLHQGGSTETLVVGIGTAAHTAGTAQGGHTARGAGSEKGKGDGSTHVAKR